MDDGRRRTRGAGGLREFLAFVPEHPELYADLQDLDPRPFCAQMIQLGALYGYLFSAEEVETLLAERRLEWTVSGACA